MYKQNLGISVYPEHFKEDEVLNYLDKCYSPIINCVFFSLIQFGTEIKKELKDKYVRLMIYAQKKGYYVILDISHETLTLFGITGSQLGKIKDYGVDCIRLDAPMLPKHIADATFQGIDVQLNMSNNDSIINNVIDFRPNLQRLSGSHNFYPLIGSAPSKEFFIEASKRYVNLNIHTTCFVGGETGNKGPQKHDIFKLVSCELLRNLSLAGQVKWAFSTGLISTVIVGNQPLTDMEIEILKSIKLDGVFDFNLKLTEKITPYLKEILNFNNHFWRGDASDNFIRSTLTRVVFKEGLEPQKKQQKLSFGDVCVINSNNKNYQNEVLIILKDNYESKDNSFNKIGHILEDDLELLKNLKPWDKFRFSF